MDSRRFDALARALVAAGSRRGLLGIASALPFAGGLAALLGEDEVAAQGRRKRRKKRHKHGKGRRRKHHKGRHKKHKKHKKKETCAGDVCASGCQYTSIQAAIDDPDGPATLRLCAETYGETITIDKDLTLIGAGDGEDGTVLDGEGSGPVVMVNGGVTVEIQALRITGGEVESRGGGIDNDGTIILNSTTVIDNVAGDDGGGIQNNGMLTLTESSVTHNEAGDDAGGILNNSMLTLVESTVTDNRAPKFGGGIYNVAATMTLTESSVTHNEAGDDGGGIYNSGTVTLNDSSVTDNTAGGDGGGILNRGTVTLNDSSNVADNDPDDCVDVFGGTGCP